jgi:hypothetical protein
VGDAAGLVRQADQREAGTGHFDSCAGDPGRALWL